MKNSIYLIFSVITLIVALLFQIYPIITSKTVKPNKFNGSIICYSDSSKIVGQDGGNSIIEIDSINSDGLYYNQTLNNGFNYYYAGVIFIFKDSLPIDLKQYTNINLTLNTGNTNSMRFFILTKESKYSNNENISSWRHLRKVINTKEKLKSYNISIKDLYTPQWWYETYKTDEDNLSKTPIKNVLGIKIESGEGERINVKESIIINKIVFYKPLSLTQRFLQITLIIISLILLGIRLGLFNRRKLGKYTPIIMGNLFDEELDRVTDYIGNNYQDSLISLNKVSESCIINSDKVSSLIKQGYGQTFKQYLNRLRLTEAQRLLRTTDRPISEIAFAVGYNNVNNFNRVFKQFYSATPREFRSK